MRTFDEAIEYALTSKTLDEHGSIGEEKLRIQTSFQQDIANSVPAHIAHMMLEEGVLRALDRSEPVEEQLKEAIESAYFNGMMLGVAVGVLMEKAE